MDDCLIISILLFIVILIWFCVYKSKPHPHSLSYDAALIHPAALT